jgi:GGDEF domain-containing protein
MHPFTRSAELTQELESMLSIHQRWLENWHKAIICQQPGALRMADDACCTESLAVSMERLEQSAGSSTLRLAVRCHLEVHRQAASLLHRIQAGSAPEAREYEQLLDMESAFRDHLQEGAYQLGGSRARAYSRHELKLRLKQEHERVIRTRTSATLVMLEVWPAGAQAGERLSATPLFRQVASYLSRSLRPYDILYELGEGQYLICLSGVNTVAAIPTAQRLGNEIGCLINTLAPEALDQMEIRSGIADLDPLANLDIVIERAHAALEEAAPMEIQPGFGLTEPPH